MPEKLKQMEVINISESLAKGIDFVGSIIFWIVVGAFAIWVISKFISGIKTLRGEV